MAAVRRSGAAQRTRQHRSLLRGACGGSVARVNPFPHPAPGPARPLAALPRRRLLALGVGVVGALGSAACAGSPASSTGPEGSSAALLAALPAQGAAVPVAPDDVAIARRTARDAADLAAAVRQLGRRHRQLRLLARTLGAHHDAHVRAFTLVGEQPPRGTERPAARTPADALRLLSRAEQRAAEAARAAAIDAKSGAVAQALAACAASRIQHLRLIDAALQPGPAR